VTSLHRHHYLAVLLLALGTASATAQTAEGQPAAGGGDALKILSDPSDFRSRFELRNEYAATQGGGSVNALVPRLEYAHTPALAFRLELPFVATDPNRPGTSQTSGLGDLTARVAWRLLRTADSSLVAVAEFSVPSAENSQLGIRRYVFKPSAYLVHDLPRYKSTLFPYVQQFWAFGGTSDVDINTTLLGVGVLTRLPNRSYSFVEPSVYIDWERSGRTGATLEVELGRFFTKTTGLYLRPGVGLWGDNIPPVYDWNFEVGLRYFF